LKRLASIDPKLEDQARRAAMSVSLNIAEARATAIASASVVPPTSEPRSMSRSHSATSPTMPSPTLSHYSIASAR
jgi:hypothetical protein